MIMIKRILVLLATLVTLVHSQSNLKQRQKYQHFDDYLINNSDKVVIIDVNGEYDLRQPTESNKNIGTSTTTTTTTTTTESSNQSNTTEEDYKALNQAVNCCYLGRVAGERGYHCHVGFYANRIMRRNENRAHNKKLYFNGAHRDGIYGTQIMRQFESCIATMGSMFHKCCKMASRVHLKGPRYDTAKRLHSG